MEILSTTITYDVIPRPFEVQSIGFGILWTSDKGFGELYTEIDQDGTIQIDTEYMGKEHFLELMGLLYDKAKVDDDANWNQK